MLRIVLISVNGSPATSPVVAMFGEAGGGIGRDEGNVLVLPDPDRRLSRVQALVRFEHGTYRIIDQGASPTVINGVALRKGNSRILREGDLIEAAGFRLQVSLPNCDRTEIIHRGKALPETGSKDPFDDLLADTPVAKAHSLGFSSAGGQAS